MWDSCKGVKINSGFGTEGKVNLRFWAKDCKTLVKEEFGGVYKTVEKGKDVSEYFERQFRNLYWIGSETINGDRRRSRSIESMEDLEGTTFPAFLPLWLAFKNWSLKVFSYRGAMNNQQEIKLFCT